VANHLLIVMSNSAPGLDDEFNRWYEEEHLQWVTDSLPGLINGRRYVQAALPGHPDHPYRYIAMYEIAEDRLDEAFAQFAANRQQRAAAQNTGDAPTLVVSESMDMAGSLVGFFSPIGTPVVAGGGR
jgi:hypothetical protein